MSVLQEFETSIAAGIEAGLIDDKQQAGIIAAARKIASVMDSDGWPIIAGGRFDNVSASTFLKYCQSLGIVVETDSSKKVPSYGGKLDAAKASSPIFREGKT